MTETNVHTPPKDRRRRRCLTAVGVITLILLLIFIIALILAVTVFKPKEPRTELLSASLEGVSPRISLPVVNIKLNVTLNLKLLVKNPNHVSFKHGPGKSYLLYRGDQVGDADVYPGMIPSRGSEILPARLTIEVDALASNMESLISDVLGGQLILETRTRIPGRVTLLGIFKKHVVATSVCQFTIAVPSFKIQSQQCKNKTKL
ncbi:hypothetical protein Tsubulata_000073 [Turnera subulata]|uniref:Late embryogenesis abundant protein LEA-2 subgroup domain-containing protein n=1 Tax=Turnera subulata TaxID=218843 RepID=A0A9Q0J9F0_9ROSI|nr:hypothetical protein Tsubulata_000073 [Turnera subulata]